MKDCLNTQCINMLTGMKVLHRQRQLMNKTILKKSEKTYRHFGHSRLKKIVQVIFAIIEMLSKMSYSY